MSNYMYGEDVEEALKANSGYIQVGDYVPPHLLKVATFPQANFGDNVNHPLHYNRKGIECIDAIEAALSEEEFLGYLRGNCLKYQWRCRYKGKAIEDIQKSDWYSNKLKEKLKEYGKAQTSQGQKSKEVSKKL